MEFRLKNKRFIKRKIKSWNGKIVNDLSNIKDFKPCETIFRANSNECNLLFKLGKITINDIIIDEVEINGDIKEVKEVIQTAAEVSKKPSILKLTIKIINIDITKLYSIFTFMQIYS